VDSAINQLAFLAEDFRVQQKLFFVDDNLVKTPWATTDKRAD